MSKSYPDITARISANLKTLRKDIPDTMAGFSALAQAAGRDGVLDRKTICGRPRKRKRKIVFVARKVERSSVRPLSAAG